MYRCVYIYFLIIPSACTPSVFSLPHLSNSAGGSFSLNGSRCDTHLYKHPSRQSHTHTHTHTHTHGPSAHSQNPLPSTFLLIIPISPARSPSCWLSVQLKRGKVTLCVISAFHSSSVSLSLSLSLSPSPSVSLSLSLLHLFSVVRVITTDSESQFAIKEQEPEVEREKKRDE